MTGVTTGQVTLATCTDSDDTEAFLTGSLTTDLQTVSDKFHNSTGHNHDASGEGAPIGVAGLAAAVGNFGAWTAFTPALQQSNVMALSSAVGRYTQVGKSVEGLARCVASAAGTGGVAIALTGLPVAARGDSNVLCWGTFSRAGNPNYLLMGQAISTTSVNFYSGGGATGLFGVNPAITIASGDVIDVHFAYEAA